MGINNPVPRDLGAESKKAAKILASFVKPNQIVNYDEVIPPHVLRNAKGLAVLTVLKAGFLFSGRAGSGVIVARLPDGTWSPPAGIMTAGAGAGGMIGAELTDFIFVLNTKDAVKAFSSFGTLTLGGNISVAAGPLGRSGEAAGAAGTGGVTAIFSYAKTKGLYAGVSLEGSAIVERRDANQKFYGRNVTPAAILSGRVRAPRSVAPLFRVLDSRAFRSDWDDTWEIKDIYDDIPDEIDSVYSRSSRGGRSAATGSGRRSGRYSDDEDDDDTYDYRSPNSRRGGADRSRYDDEYDDDRRSGTPRKSGSGRYDDDGYDDDYEDSRYSRSRQSGGRNYDDDDYDDRRRSERGYTDSYSRRRDEDDLNGRFSRTRLDDRSPPPPPKPKAAANGMQGIALYSFAGEQQGDLAFRKGDVIKITAKSNSTDDWWTGELNGRTGIFPANYVELA